MEGKTIQVELAGNILEATGLAVVNYNNVDYLIYSLGEEYTKEGSTYDKIYISQTGSYNLAPITQDVWGEIQKVISDLGESIKLNVIEYTLKLVEEDRYKIFEPRKLATPKNICRELSKKVKKLEEELNKPAVEQPVQTEETQPVETPTNTVDDINEANKKLNAAINKIKELLSDKDIDILQ